MDQNGDGTSSSRSMASTDDTATAPALPDDDVLVEILLHLPAKSVLRFRAVCKLWRSLLSDPGFINDHHRRAPIALILNGNKCRHFVCNPATREFTRLPADLGRQVEFVGFYRHAPTGEHRVLCHNLHHPRMIYEYLVAAPGQHAARRLGPSNLWTDTDRSLIDEPVTHRGCLHWMLWRRSKGAVVFDTISEEFRRMRGQVDGDTRTDSMFGRLVGVDGTLGASLFAADERVLKLWVLESYEEEAWALRYKVDASFFDPGGPFFSISLTHVSEEGDAVLMTFGRKRVGVYNLRRGQVVSAMQKPFHGHLHGTDHIYQESLLSLAPKGVGDTTRV